VNDHVQQPPQVVAFLPGPVSLAPVPSIALWPPCQCPVLSAAVEFSHREPPRSFPTPPELSPPLLDLPGSSSPPLDELEKRRDASVRGAMAELRLSSAPAYLKAAPSSSDLTTSLPILHYPSPSPLPSLGASPCPDSSPWPPLASARIRASPASPRPLSTTRAPPTHRRTSPFPQLAAGAPVPPHPSPAEPPSAMAGGTCAPLLPELHVLHGWVRRGPLITSVGQAPPAVACAADERRRGGRPHLCRRGRKETGQRGPGLFFKKRWQLLGRPRWRG
jgi:hypothetical protein